MSADRLGVSAYARHRKAQGLPGQTHASVRKAIERRTLTAKSVERSASGRAQIDAELADQEWLASTDPAQQREPEVARGRFSGPADAALTGHTNPELRVDSGDGSDPNRTADLRDTIRQSQAAHIAFKAKMIQLDYEERAGALCSTRDVDAEGYRIARLVRGNLLGLRSKISAQLAAEGDQHKVAQILGAHLVQALEELLPLILKLEPDHDPAPEAAE